MVGNADRNFGDSNVGNMMSLAWSGLWWDMLARGIIAVIFGLLVFFMPGLSIVIFVLLFGSFAIADGILLLLQAVTVRDGNWWVRLIQGIVALAAGAAMFMWPRISALALLYVIAFYLIITGLLQAISAIEFRKWVKGDLLLLVSGILAIIVGVLLVMKPLTGAIALAQTIGIFAIAYGILLGILALKLQGSLYKATRTA
jgi:uncharacterized membrane protein HdeD (DUF308 family)